MKKSIQMQLKNSWSTPIFRTSSFHKNQGTNEGLIWQGKRKGKVQRIANQRWSDHHQISIRNSKRKENIQDKIYKPSKYERWRFENDPANECWSIFRKSNHVYEMADNYWFKKEQLEFLQSHFGLGWMFSKDSSFSIKMPEQEQSNNKFNIWIRVLHNTMKLIWWWKV